MSIGLANINGVIWILLAYLGLKNYSLFSEFAIRCRILYYFLTPIIYLFV